jgi:hypothetical protein
VNKEKRAKSKVDRELKKVSDKEKALDATKSDDDDDDEQSKSEEEEEEEVKLAPKTTKKVQNKKPEPEPASESVPETLVAAPAVVNARRRRTPLN